jgi:hypothetical protein
VNSGPAGKLSLHRSPFTFENHTVNLLQTDARHQNCCDRKTRRLVPSLDGKSRISQKSPNTPLDIAVIPLYIATLTNIPCLIRVR